MKKSYSNGDTASSVIEILIFFLVKTWRGLDTSHFFFFLLPSVIYHIFTFYFLLIPKK